MFLLTVLSCFYIIQPMVEILHHNISPRPWKSSRMQDCPRPLRYPTLSQAVADDSEQARAQVQACLQPSGDSQHLLLLSIHFFFSPGMSIWALLQFTLWNEDFTVWASMWKGREGLHCIYAYKSLNENVRTFSCWNVCKTAVRHKPQWEDGFLSC